MITVAITGGIACGKSFVVSRLGSEFPTDQTSCFNSDEVVKALLLKPRIVQQISDIHSSVLVDQTTGELDKAVLRKLAFENPEFREKLEALLHPLVLEEAHTQIGASRKTKKIIFVEVPLLYEVSFPLERDLDLVVAASPRTQKSRLLEFRKLDTDIAKKMIKAQMPLQEKINRGDVVVWNDGDKDSLQGQIEHLADRCAALFEK